MTNTQTGLLLSICIPTRGRNDILQKTLNSIFSSNVDISEYEVVIYDSSDNGELRNILGEYYPYPNLVYKQGKNYGFLNLIEALKNGQGFFLKLHNDYSELLENSLLEMLNAIKLNLTTKPLLFFTNGHLKDIELKECFTFDEFLYSVTYHSSWSTAFGVWKTDFEDIKDISINPMFPHTSLLFALHDKQTYLVVNNKNFNNQEISRKGGYNLFETFAVTYLKMVDDCLKDKKISQRTFQHIKKDMFENFLIAWYCDTKILKNQYTFILTGIKSSMSIYYSEFSYYHLISFAHIRAIGKLIKGVIKKILVTKKSV